MRFDEAHQYGSSPVRLLRWQPDLDQTASANPDELRRKIPGNKRRADRLRMAHRRPATEEISGQGE